MGWLKQNAGKKFKFARASYYPKKYMLKYNYTGKFTSLD